MRNKKEEWIWQANNKNRECQNCEFSRLYIKKLDIIVRSFFECHILIDFV